MGPEPTRGGWQPSREQWKLLRAALLDPAKALPAWTAWLEGGALPGADEASDRLLCMVYHNLSGTFPDAPSLAKLKPCYRGTWLRNQASAS